MPQKLSDRGRNRGHTRRRGTRSLFVRGTAAAMLGGCGILAATAVATVALGATATTVTTGTSTTTTTATQKVFRNFKCKSRVKPYWAPTWACTTVTISPWQEVSGSTATVTYSFRAKKAMKYVNLCFSKIEVTSKLSCAYSHKYRKLRKGQVVKRVFQLTVPTVTTSGGYKLDNYSRFYKRQKFTTRNLSYWLANSNICIAAASDPGYSCTAGK